MTRAVPEKHIINFSWPNNNLYLDRIIQSVTNWFSLKSCKQLLINTININQNETIDKC